MAGTPGNLPCVDVFQDFWLKKAAKSYGVPARGDSAGTLLEKVRRDVAFLSDLFTTNRPPHGRFRDYMSEEKLLSAYGLFFFPQSFARADFALRRLLEIYRWTPCGNGDADDASRPLRILDLGSGASPCGFATALALRDAFPQREIILTVADRSRGALAAARELAETIFPREEKITVKTLVADLKQFSSLRKTAFPQQDAILLGWSLNEVISPDEDAVRFLKNLAPLLTQKGVLAVFEPALKITAERLQRASDFFALNGGEPYFRLAPELGPHPCPLLREGVFWNHEVRKWNPPSAMEFINRTLFREINVLKFSWCALSKTEPSPPLRERERRGGGRLVRLVAPPEITKAALRFVAVDSQGEKQTIEFSVRGLSKNAVKQRAAQWERGDIAVWEGENLFPL